MYLQLWNKLTPRQQERLFKKFKANYQLKIK